MNIKTWLTLFLLLPLASATMAMRIQLTAYEYCPANKNSPPVYIGQVTYAVSVLTSSNQLLLDSSQIPEAIDSNPALPFDAILPGPPGPPGVNTLTIGDTPFGSAIAVSSPPHPILCLGRSFADRYSESSYFQAGHTTLRQLVSRHQKGHTLCSQLTFRYAHVDYPSCPDVLALYDVSPVQASSANCMVTGSPPTSSLENAATGQIPSQNDDDLECIFEQNLMLIEENFMSEVELGEPLPAVDLIGFLFQWASERLGPSEEIILPKFVFHPFIAPTQAFQVIGAKRIKRWITCDQKESSCKGAANECKSKEQEQKITLSFIVTLSSYGCYRSICSNMPPVFTTTVHFIMNPHPVLSQVVIPGTCQVFINKDQSGTCQVFINKDQPGFPRDTLIKQNSISYHQPPPPPPGAEAIISHPLRSSSNLSVLPPFLLPQVFLSSPDGTQYRLQ